MVISNSNLYTEGYTAVKNFLDGISNLDPRGRYKVNWIHSSMPLITSKGFSGYPFIVIQINVNESDKSFDRDTSNKVFDVLISIHSDQSTEIDSIADKITNSFKDETKLTDFKARELAASPINWNLDQNGKKILFRNMGFILKTRL